MPRTPKRKSTSGPWTLPEGCDKAVIADWRLKRYVNIPLGSGTPFWFIYPDGSYEPVPPEVTTDGLPTYPFKSPLQRARECFEGDR